MSNIRLFTALPVSRVFSAQAAALPRKGIEAAWTHQDNLHLTLRFLGDLDEERLPEIQDALRRVRRPAFTVEAKGLSVFEGKVLYARIESVRKVTTLCADITDVLTPLGFDFGMRAFVPHITLARVKRAPALESYIRQAEKGVNVRWEANSFHLMRSAGADEKGRHYSVIETYGLTS